MKRVVAFILCGCAIAGVVLTCVSLGTSAWASVVERGFKINSGLFKQCSPFGCISYPITQLPDFMKATQAFLIIAVILAFAAALYSTMVAFEKLPPIGIPVFFAGAGICTLIAMAVFTGKETFTQFGANFGYSYALGWVAFGWNFILSLVSLILIKASSGSGHVYSAMG